MLYSITPYRHSRFTASLNLPPLSKRPLSMYRHFRFTATLDLPPLSIYRHSRYAARNCDKQRVALYRGLPVATRFISQDSWSTANTDGVATAKHSGASTFLSNCESHRRADWVNVTSFSVDGHKLTLCLTIGRCHKFRTLQ
jgi:hypothetical protein